MVRRGWWTYVLWPELRRAVSEGGALRGQDPAGRKACRPAHRAAHKIRVRHQPQDRESAWPDHSAVGARAGRSPHRIMDRRAFITVVGGSIVTAPLAAEGQQQP